MQNPSRSGIVAIHSFRHLVAFIATLMFAVLSCSCNGQQATLYPVRGSVFVAGNPAEGSIVVFHAADSASPSPRPPSGIVQPDGSFELSNFTTGDGALAGNYVVTITSLGDAFDEVEEKSKAKGLPRAVRAPERYGDAKKTPLMAIVAGGSNEIPRFNLTK